MVRRITTARILRRFYRLGLAPSEIDKELQLRPGTSHDEIVYSWQQDRGEVVSTMKEDTVWDS